MRPICFLVLLLLPTGAFGQIMKDLDCSDFNSQLQAQGTYLAAQQTLLILDSLGVEGAEYERDYHGLDADGDRVACSSITTVQLKRYTIGDETFWIRFHKHAYEVKCESEPFYVHDFEFQARKSIQDTVLYNGRGSSQGFLDKFECLHTLGVIEQSR